jgi:hypothetical protein
MSPGLAGFYALVRAQQYQNWTGSPVNNWSQIIRELVAFRRHVSSDLVSAVASELRTPHQLSALQDLFRNTDPILVKIALFQLLHKGLATGDDLEVAPFSAQMLFRAS